MNNDIQELELHLQDAKKMVNLRDTLTRLTNNRDFKKVILEGYLDEEAKRLVHCFADPNLSDQEKIITEAMKGIGHFKMFLNHIIVMGNNAEQAIYDGEEQLDELRGEEVATE